MEKIIEKNIQNKLLEQIQKNLLPTISLVDELADFLEISNDSVYRRISGKTTLSIEETSKICKKYKISFDSLINNESNAVTFNYGILHTEQDFINHFKFMESELLMFKRTPSTCLTYAAIDIPIFHHFQFKELSAFKLFYWLRSVVNDKDFVQKKFNPELISPELMEYGKNMWEIYKTIHSIEIWTDATVNSLIKQIEFYWESGTFETKEDALLICSQFESEMLSIQNIAENSSKVPENNNFNLYFSEIEIGNNYILAESDIFKRSYLSYNTINILVTPHTNFSIETKIWLDNLMKKSTLISGTSEKTRYQFFKRILDAIHALQKKIKDE